MSDNISVGSALKRVMVINDNINHRLDRFSQEIISFSRIYSMCSMLYLQIEEKLSGNFI
jgi:hypothetical protein